MAKSKVTAKAKKPAAKPARTTTQRVRSTTAAIVKSPAVTEVVAATLVAAAAALKDPRQARALAASAGDEIENAGKEMAEKGNALWQLALEVAKRSMKVIAGDDKGAKTKKKGGKKKKK